MRQQLIGRFVNFARKLHSSRSPEGCVVFGIASRCARSMTGKTLLNTERESKLDPWLTPHWKIRESIGEADVQDSEGWRVHYIGKLLNVRREAELEENNLSNLF